MKRTIIVLFVVIAITSFTACQPASNNDRATYTSSQSETILNSEETSSINNSASENMRPEFKKAMDDYEAFYDEYCEFMNEYKSNPTDLSLISKYSSLMSKAADMNELFGAWDQDEMSAEELKYYLEVSSRVAQKIVDAAN